jgi:DNA replication initiation complex subunit (GINS family)
MEDSSKKIDSNFFQLVLSLQMAAMQQMGKIASPVNGKVERNLGQARASIDILGMLSEKTENNLTEDEKNLLDRALFELRMNFIDESKKSAAKREEEKESAKKADKTDDDEAKKPEETATEDKSGNEEEKKD